MFVGLFFLRFHSHLWPVANCSFENHHHSAYMCFILKPSQTSCYSWNMTSPFPPLQMCSCNSKDSYIWDIHPLSLKAFHNILPIPNNLTKLSSPKMPSHMLKRSIFLWPSPCFDYYMVLWHLKQPFWIIVTWISFTFLTRLQSRWSRKCLISFCFLNDTNKLTL